MKRRLLLPLLMLAAFPARAASPGVTLTGPDNQTVGTDANPLVTRVPSGTGGQTVSGTVTANQGAPNTGGAQAWFVQWSGMSVAVSNAVTVQGTVTANLGTTDAANLATVAARTPALGQATKAASQPVVIASDQGALTVTPNACTIAQQVVTLSAGVSTQLVGANANRKSLRWMDVGANPMTVSAGTAAAVANAGINYSAGTGAQPMGGSESFFGDGIPTGAFQAISTSGTTVAVWECQ